MQAERTKQLEWRETTDPAGRPVREFKLTREGSERPVTGALWPPAKASGDCAPMPLVLFGHGASGDRYQPPICRLAGRLAGDACALAIDGPVHGLRQVGPGGRQAFGEEMKRPTFVDDMIRDWHAALAAARNELDVSACAYFGLSMGSMFGIPLLAQLPEAKCAVLGLLGTGKAGRPMARRLLADAANIACPVLFLMQLEDELFPRDGCLELFDALASKDKRLHANPGLHPEVPAEEIDNAVEFLRQRLSARSAMAGRPAQAGSRLDAAALGSPARAAVTTLLRSLSGELAEFGVTEVWLFGSVARGDDHAQSDIDIAVRTRDPFDWTCRYDVAAFLQSHISRRVDLATLPLGDRLASVAGEDLVRVV